MAVTDTTNSALVTIARNSTTAAISNRVAVSLGMSISSPNKLSM